MKKCSIVGSTLVHLPLFDFTDGRTFTSQTAKPWS
jgi:hypothetical protein